MMERFEELRYNGILVEKQIKLLQSINLILARQRVIAHGGTNTTVDFLSVTPEGERLVRWTVADF